MNCAQAFSSLVAKRVLVFALLGTYLFISISEGASAGEFSVGTIQISKVWSRATPKGARVGAGYLTIHNLGSKPDRLISVQSQIAERVEMHSMSITNGIMRMRPISNGIALRPDESVALRPGADHLMFIGLRGGIAEGDRFAAVLVFENAGRVRIVFQAGAIGSAGPPK